ncbi:putrescine transporter permease PotH [Salmonella enterica subsp. enterica]|uniref:Putrescine transporter permease PotH n=12 Tax=Enterobacteriaceae TaxID=543 RepID=A0A447MV96_SALET|nr:putrescine transporter permease PotH [Salmonella enterica subsp. enterica]
MSTLEPPARISKPGGAALWLARMQMKHGRKLVIALPYIWLILLFLLPFLIVFKISLAEMARAIPPYTDLLEWADGQLSITLNLGNFLQLTDDPLYFEAYLQSLQIAGISTICCLLLGYPLAWAVAHSKPSTRNILLLLVILPSWTSFLIRVYAWMGILKNNGVLNNVLLWLGVIDQPLTILHTNLAVYIGIVYAYLPFMVLPIYTALTRIDYSLVEASLDLGARPLKTFFSIIVPLTKGGIIAGSMLVFIPAVGEFVIPELLGGPDSIMIGRVLWQEFFNNRDWPVASAVAIIMLLLLIVPIMWFHKHQQKSVGGARMNNLPVVRSPWRILILVLGFTFLYAPMLMLVIYSFNSSKLVTVWAGMVDALVWRALSGYRHDERSGTKPDNCRLRGDDGGGARYYRRGGDGAIWTISRRKRLCVYDHRAAGDAGCDYRAVAAAAVCRARSCYRLALRSRDADHLVGARHFLYRLCGSGDRFAITRTGSFD